MVYIFSHLCQQYPSKVKNCNLFHSSPAVSCLKSNKKILDIIRLQHNRGLRKLSEPTTYFFLCSCRWLIVNSKTTEQHQPLFMWNLSLVLDSGFWIWLKGLSHMYKQYMRSFSWRDYLWWKDTRHVLCSCSLPLS